jgi:translation elongation factor P/translation initiation factor 5A
MAVPATQIRKGMVIVFEGDPCRVIDFRHHTPGNLRAMVQTKMKNLRNGSNFEHRFRADDAIEKASMETHELQFMYSAGDTYHFMNTENFDQIEMEAEASNPRASLLDHSRTPPVLPDSSGLSEHLKHRRLSKVVQRRAQHSGHASAVANRPRRLQHTHR